MKTGVYGDAEVAAALREMAKGVPVGLVDKAALDSMQPMLVEAKENAKDLRDYVGKYSSFFPQPVSPRPGGNLDMGLQVRRIGGNKTARRYWLAAARRARKLAHLVEFGTAPHWQPNFKGGWMHPGAQAKPFLTPAFDQHKNEVISRFGRFLWERIRDKALTLSQRARRRRP